MKARAIIPKQRPKDSTFFLGLLKTESRKVQNHAVELFEATTATWEDTHPRFLRPFTVTPKGVQWKVYTKNGVYFMLNWGTTEHIIRARRKKTLAFQRDYAAKTRPRVLQSYAGGKSGPWETPTVVLHPGQDSRNYDWEVRKVIEPECLDALKTAIDRWMKASKM